MTIYTILQAIYTENVRYPKRKTVIIDQQPFKVLASCKVASLSPTFI